MTAESRNSNMPRAVITDALQLARQLCALHQAAQATAARTVKALETALAATVQRGVQLPVDGDLRAAHRRAHRAGFPSKIEADLAVRAFVLERLDRLTFGQIVTEVKAVFPPERHIHTRACIAGGIALASSWHKPQPENPRVRTRSRFIART